MSQTLTQPGAAYRRSTTPKQAEAQVFARVLHALRDAQGPIATARARSDAYRLWAAVLDSVMDPSNQLPPALRGQIASVARCVIREFDAAEPDMPFVIEMTEQLSGGLWS